MAINEVQRTSFREVDSKSELLELLRSSGGHNIIIGANAESPRMCFLLELSNEAGTHLKIGMILSGHGIKPSWILSPTGNAIAIGHDLTISFVDLSQNHLVSSQELDSAFFEFVPEKSGDHFLVLHELGIDRFDYSGTRLWSVPILDIAESAYFRNEKTLVVRHWPGNELQVDIATGRSDAGTSCALTREIEVLKRAYSAFNARDIDGALATMGPDVVWPNGMEGGTVHGHEGVRAYWTRQWGVINPHVDPVRFTEDESGRIIVDVHQVVRDLSDKVLLDRMVQHVYTLRDGLIQSMDIRE